jgi:hypothetical protein
MKLLRSKAASEAKKGAALLLSFMVLIVVVTIVTQISLGTMTDARVARNDLALAHMDLAIESAMIQTRIQLRDDAAADSESEGGEGEDGGPAIPDVGDMGGDEEGGGEEAPADKKADFPTERTELNEISLRIQIQDEDGKINILNMLSADEERAEEAFQRVVRVLDLFREGTEFDVPLSEAIEIAEVMRRHMLERDTQLLPRPELLSDSAEEDRRGLPLGLREFLIHEELQDVLFMDFRDENDTIVHSIESFLTVWSSPRLYSSNPDAGSTRAPASDAGAPESDGPTTGSGANDTDTGGYAVNVNTAPPVVLKALFDDRVVNPAFWDEVIEFRNLEDEEAMEDENGERREPIYDQFGEEELELQFFGTTEDLAEVRSWGDFDGDLQSQIKDILTTKSSTFSIVITARRSTSANEESTAGMDPREAARKEEESDALKKVVRAVVWRHQVEDEFVVTPIVPWEVLPSSPYDVLDYPEEDR